VNALVPDAAAKSLWPPAQAALLPGHRLHLQHGPIDLVIKAGGAAASVNRAYRAARERFRSVLGELVAELAVLRAPLHGDRRPLVESAIAMDMVAVCWPHRAVFISPMAAVAGSVADAISQAMLKAVPELDTLYVNNGGDIALHVAEDHHLRIGLVADLARAIPEGAITVTSGSRIGGIATSGWRGRSFSLGIADAVTVLAPTAAMADAAATIIANAVHAEHPAVVVAPARSIDPDSDLGDLYVTVKVGRLPMKFVEAALARGMDQADTLVGQGLICAAALTLQGHWQFSGVRSGLFLPMA
jgi:ApbE superfamily uncharacterized protein (UPF0280 family)